MAVDSKDYANQAILTGRFTSASSAADVVETLPWAPSVVIVWLALGATSPNMLVYTNAFPTETMLTTGSTGVITTPAAASGLVVSTTAFTVTIPSGVQTNDGVNAWIAIK
jgi:hypothetical protein